MDNGVLTNRDQDLASCLDTIMTMVVSLSQRVDAHVGVTTHPEGPPAPVIPPKWERRKATTHDAPVQDFLIDQVVRQRLAESLR